MQDNTDSLKDILYDLLNQSTQLIEFLQKENKALLNDDTDQLLELAASKQELYANFDKTEKKFMTVMKQDENKDWKNDSKISDLWTTLVEQVSACKKQNLINGFSMTQQISSLKRFISFLSSGDTADKVCYNRKADIQTEKKIKDKAIA